MQKQISTFVSQRRKKSHVPCFPTYLAFYCVENGVAMVQTAAISVSAKPHKASEDAISSPSTESLLFRACAKPCGKRVLYRKKELSRHSRGVTGWRSAHRPFFLLRLSIATILLRLSILRLAHYPSCILISIWIWESHPRRASSLGKIWKVLIE